MKKRKCCDRSLLPAAHGTRVRGCVLEATFAAMQREAFAVSCHTPALAAGGPTGSHVRPVAEKCSPGG
jgi:hypothetical protein